MPLIAFAVAAYAAGLLAGFAIAAWWPALATAGLGLSVILRGASTSLAGCLLVFAIGATVALDSAPPPTRAQVWKRSGPVDSTALERWRAGAGQTIDRLFGTDAPVVRALLIADTRQLPAEIRDRYSRAGLVHLLSISGLHVAIISGAVLLALQMLRLGLRTSRWLAVAITVLYVIAIGAPPPALRSGAMLAAGTLAWALQRPVSPWATLALGAAVPLVVDPRTVLDLGYQLSVTGFAALVAATVWMKRISPDDLSGIRRRLLSDFAISCVASVAAIPLVAWHFARISLIAPFTNIVAAPVVAAMQPALFLALVLAPFGAPAMIIADGARLLVRALDAIAKAGAAVPGASIVVAPSLTVAWASAAAVAFGLAAIAARSDRPRWALCAALCTLGFVWQPIVPRPTRGMEVHLIDVGQGDAIAIRTPGGRWIMTDAGGGRGAGNSGPRIAIPYVRARGGNVALFIMTHPHDDHLGGAAALISQLAPDDVRDAAFAGTSPSYREALQAARATGVAWRRIRPGDSVEVDGVVATFLAPDSAWTAGLTDPNLASAVVRIRHGAIRLLLTGDAEAAEEEWLLRHARGLLAAEILKVAHHGSATSSTAGFLDAVRPQIGLVSVGAGNRYRHPSPGVLSALEARGVRVLRTDLLGTIILRTDVSGTRVEIVGRK